MEYLKYYLGCNVQLFFRNNILNEDFKTPRKLLSVFEGDNITISVSMQGVQSYIIDGNLQVCKPILRRIDSLTDEEWEDIMKIVGKYDVEDGYYPKRDSLDEWYSDILDLSIGEPKIWHEILKLHIDLFNLIDNNLAIDAQTLK